MGTIRVRFPVGARDTPVNLALCCFHAIIVSINENMGPSVCLVCAYLSFTQKVRVRFPYGLLWFHMQPMSSCRAVIRSMMIESMQSWIHVLSCSWRYFRRIVQWWELDSEIQSKWCFDYISADSSGQCVISAMTACSEGMWSESSGFRVRLSGCPHGFNMNSSNRVLTAWIQKYDQLFMFHVIGC